MNVNDIVANAFVTVVLVLIAVFLFPGPLIVNAIHGRLGGCTETIYSDYPCPLSSR